MGGDGGRGRPRSTFEQKFWSKIDITPSMVDGCWLWVAARDGRGYGMFKFDGHIRAHRVSYEAFVGPIPEGLEIDHLCRVRNCVRPDHLEAVTHAENTRRAARARELRPPTRNGSMDKTHCPQGHPYNEENTYVYPSPRQPGKMWRGCRICRRDTNRRLAAERKLVADARRVSAA